MDDSNLRYDLKVLYEQSTRFVLANIRYITRTTTFLLLGIILLHKFFPQSVDWIEQGLNLAPPSLPSILTLIVAVWVFERILVIQNEVRQPVFTVTYPRVKAYRELRRLIKDRGAKKVDLLQVSGHTAERLLRDLGERYPRAEVRLLLLHPSVASQFDGDDQVNHRYRIQTTIQEVELVERENPGFHVSKKFYKTPAGVSAVIVGPTIVSLSWYHCYKDPEAPNVTRIRGHEAPTITALDDLAQPLVSFASQQFERVWKTAEDIYNEVDI